MVRRISLALSGAAALFAIAGVALASHAWGNYHWARSANPFTLKLGDNVSFTWDPYLTTTSVDWSLSSVLDTAIIAGSGGRNCKAKLGRAEICNAKYGNNGWLGIAQIWINGTGHITQGIVKMNDTYFNTSTYNKPAWRNLVMCQEVGHVFGLDHQDENFGNTPLGTCMDYSSDPTLNQHPNAHDYEQLELIYAHLDDSTTIGSDAPTGKKSRPEKEGEDTSVPDIDVSDKQQWGKVVRTDGKGRPNLHERDLGKGHKVFTHVFWAE